MKKTIFKFLLISVVIIFTSCADEILNLEPLNNESSAIYYDFDENCLKALASCYNANNRGNNNIGSPNIIFLYGDLPSDDAVKGGRTETDGWDYQQVASFTASSANPLIISTWENLYMVITRTNELITNIEKQEVISDLKKQYMGEAKFLRAYAYSQLVLQFGRVPIFDRVVLPQEFKLITRSATEKEVFDFIKKDLDDAIAVLPQKGETEVGHATKGAAQSLKARVCMRETGYYYNPIMKARAPEYNTVDVNQLWQEVYDQTDAVISSGKYALLSNYAVVFEEKGENKEETVFDLQYVRDLSASNPGNGLPVRMGVRGFGGWGFNQPKDDLFAKFSRNGDVDPRRECTIISEEWPVGWGFNIVDDIMMGSNLAEYEWITKDPQYDYTIYKTMRKGIPTLQYMPGGRGQLPTNIRVIRYSDVLLMNAEASYFLGKEQEARDRVNEVRERARNSTYPPGAFLGDIDENKIPINYVAFPNANLPDITSSGNDLLEDIRHERRVELSMEGLRYYDIIRTADIQKLAYSDAYKAKKGLWPLPENDVYTYGLEQNEGY